MAFSSRGWGRSPKGGFILPATPFIKDGGASGRFIVAVKVGAICNGIEAARKLVENRREDRRENRRAERLGMFAHSHRARRNPEMTATACWLDINERATSADFRHGTDEIVDTLAGGKTFSRSIAYGHVPRVTCVHTIRGKMTADSRVGDIGRLP
jgi:hypothetical protein